MTTNVARSGQRQVPFFKPILVTDTRQTSRKFVVNFFPKEITPWPGQDSNQGPSAPDPDALITRPQRLLLDHSAHYSVYSLNVIINRINIHVKRSLSAFCIGENQLCLITRFISHYEGWEKSKYNIQSMIKCFILIIMTKTMSNYII